MPNKQIAVGARTKVLMDVETSYGVAPTTPGGVLLPINSFSLKPSRAKNTPGTLTGRYDPAEPFDGNLEVSGGVVVPVDARAFGHWLRAMFGAPATTGRVNPPPRRLPMSGSPTRTCRPSSCRPPMGTSTVSL